jgi:hypothetical protein
MTARFILKVEHCLGRDVLSSHEWIQPQVPRQRKPLEKLTRIDPTSEDLP